MIQLNDVLQLQPVRSADQPELFALMRRIYPPAYGHLWKDNGENYVTSLYTSPNVIAELKEPDSFYYFVNYGSEKIGILRVVDNTAVPELNLTAAVKLHRIYLAATSQGHGVGTVVINWVWRMFCEPTGKLLWLEAMDTQASVVHFYEQLGFQKRVKRTFDSDLMHEKYRGMHLMTKGPNLEIQSKV